jgi:hypothetical protein
MAVEEFTSEEINAAFARVQERKLATHNGFQEILNAGLPADVVPYAYELAVTNVAKWVGRGETITAASGFAAGWMDGILVGLELERART